MQYATPFQIVLNIIMYLSLYVLLRKVYIDKGRSNNTTIVIASIITLLYCLYSFWGPDYFHYLSDYIDVKQGGDSNMEDFYENLVKLTPSYTWFRFVVWGGGLAFLFATFKRSQLTFGRLLFVFSMLYLPWFSYARVSMAIALVFLALSFLANKSRHNIVSFLFACLLLYLSTFLHKTAIFGVLVAILTLVSNKFAGKKILPFLLVLVLISIYLLRTYIVEFMLLDIDDNFIISTGQAYLDAEQVTSGWGIIIHNVLQRTPYYLLCYLYYLLIRDKSEVLDNQIKYYGTSLVIIVIVSSLFLLDFGFNTYTLYYRFLNFGMIPATFLIAYCKEKKFFPKYVNVIVIIGIMAAVYSLSYSLYNRL